MREAAARPGADPDVVAEVTKWLRTLTHLVPWEQLASRFRLLVPNNNDFDVMDFYNPYPRATAEKYDAIRTKALEFVDKLDGSAMRTE